MKTKVNKYNGVLKSLSILALIGFLGVQVVLLSSSKAFSQNNTVAGVVTDAQTGNTLTGVNILVVGTTKGTTTDTQGHYSINVPSLQDTLRFSFIGYKQQSIPINGRTTINVSLKTTVVSGKQLVVVGYGTQRQQDVTGSIQTISSQDIENVSLLTPDAMMRGRVAGVSVHKNSNAPGGSISVDVHGVTSLTASGQPLYVVDGIPLSSDFSTNFDNADLAGSSYNPLNSIDPSNIKSIEILKSASASAIYGSRGSNGVVLITTKGGIEGQNDIEINSSVGFSDVIHVPKFMGADDYARQLNLVRKLNGRSPGYSDQEINQMGRGTDWADLLFRKAVSQKYDLTFSGGSSKLRYLIAGNYASDQGTVIGSGLHRYGGNIKLDADISSRFKAGGSLMYSVTDNKRISANSKGYGAAPNVLTALVKISPIVPAFDENGDYADPGNFPFNGGAENPLLMATQYKKYSNVGRILGNLHAAYDVTNHLTLKSRIGVDTRNWRYHTYFPIGSQKSAPGWARQISEKTVNFVNNNTINYKRDINKNNRISVLAGFVFRQERDASLQADSRGFPNNSFTYHNLGAGNDPSAPSSYTKKWRKLSYFGRINYSLLDKYILTGTVRRDGVSKFGVNNRWATFPSAAVAWRLGEESFVKKVDAISHLKLKFGWGKTGNASIGTYASRALMVRTFSNNGGYYYNGQIHAEIAPGGVANPDLTWEKTTGYNVGIDIGFVKERLSMNIDLYSKKSNSLLLEVPLPQQNGFNSAIQNAGSMENKGIGINLISRNIQSHNFSWSTTLNFSHNQNKITSLGGLDHIYTGWVGGGNLATHGGDAIRLQVGHPTASFYGSTYMGPWKSQQEIDDVGTMPSADPGSPRYKDLNGDGTYSSDKDDRFLGDANPDFTYGISNTFSYKNLSLYVMAYGSYGNKVLDLGAKRLWYTAKGTGALRVGNSWTPNNTDAEYPGFGSVNRVSNALLANGSYLKIGNITFTYAIPIEQLGLGTLKKLQVGVTATNVAVFTPYKGFDPEINSFGDNNEVKGVDRYGYPLARTIQFKLKVKF
jgi:TonB-linked SusC/RagA family outer membrane protein